MSTVGKAGLGKCLGLCGGIRVEHGSARHLAAEIELEIVDAFGRADFIEAFGDFAGRKITSCQKISVDVSQIIVLVCGNTLDRAPLKDT